MRNSRSRKPISFLIPLLVLFASLSLSASALAAATIPTLPAGINADYSGTVMDTTFFLPIGGTTYSLHDGDNLQTALNAANPGDVIQLDAGATFRGNFTVPKKSGSGWVYIITSAYSQLPTPGTRVNPSHSALLPKIVTPNTSPALKFLFGAHNYRFVGVEIMCDPQVSSLVYNLVLMTYDANGNAPTQVSDLATDIVFDRSYIHGAATQEVRRGILADAIRFAAIDAYVGEIHVLGYDSQAIGAFNGAGPYKIVNNELQASTENVMFGGADASIPNLIPSDIEIRNNHFFKPLTWKADDPSYAGDHWTVKNLFELKNAQRVLVIGNVMENSWVDAQIGYALVFTPRNSSGGNPWTVVNDVTTVYNVVRHAARGLNLLGHDDSTYPVQGTNRILVRDNLFEDLSDQWGTGCCNAVFQILDGPLDTTIDHNTVINLTHGDNTMGFATDPNKYPILNFEHTNNLEAFGPYGICSDYGSGCSMGTYGLSQVAPNNVFLKNVIVNFTANPATYPPGNYYPTTAYTAVGFVDYAGGDYHLAVSSPYKDQGTDGKDIGADIDLVNSYTAGVVTGNGSDELLTVTAAGTGSGTVTSDPAGINCGATCSASFDGGTLVTLTATPNTDSTFAGWSGGGCSGAGTCTVMMTAPLTVTATFSLSNPTKGLLTSPAPGSTLAGSSVTFTWSAGSGVSEFYLQIGSTPTGTDIYYQSQGTNTSGTITGLPTDGRTLYVSLWSKLGSRWAVDNATYKAALPSGNH